MTSRLILPIILVFSLLLVFVSISVSAKSFNTNINRTSLNQMEDNNLKHYLNGFDLNRSKPKIAMMDSSCTVINTVYQDGRHPVPGKLILINVNGNINDRAIASGCSATFFSNDGEDSVYVSSESNQNGVNPFYFSLNNSEGTFTFPSNLPGTFLSGQVDSNIKGSLNVSCLDSLHRQNSFSYNMTCRLLN